MKRRLLLAGVALLVLGAAGYGGLTWWRVRQHAEILARAAPDLPDLAGWPEALGRRLQACLDGVHRGNDRVAALGELSRVFHANGFFAEAAFCYVSLEQLQPGEPVWPHRHAAILAGFGEVEAALPHARRAAELAPRYVAAHLRLGELLLKDNQFDAAAAVYREILERQPGEPYAELGLARCDFEAGRWEPARVRLERLVTQTNHRLGYDLIVTVYERLGQPQRAATLRGRQQASGAYRDPADPWIDGLIEDCYDPFRLSLSAGFLAGAGDPVNAIKRLERAIALSPGNFALHFQLAGVHMSTRSYTRAREQFELCTQLAPEFPDGWIHLSELLLTVGDRTASDRVLAEGLARCPNSPGLHLIRAERLKRLGRIEEAIAEYRASIELRPNEAAAGVELARLLIAQQRVPEARIELQRALTAEPEHPGALSILTFDAISSGDEAVARQWLRRARNQPRIPADQMDALLNAFAQKFGRRFE